MKEDEMGGACSTHGSDEKCIQYFGWKPWREKACRIKIILKWEDNIRMYLREVVWEGVDWIYLVLVWDQWWAFVNTVIEPSGSMEGGEFLA
jgi:hypothetical protein